MELYLTKNNVSGSKNIVVDDMFLTTDMPTTAGSKMLDGYMSLFDAEALVRLYSKGYGLVGKADVGEFAFDLVGETSYNGACTDGGVLKNASAESIKPPPPQEYSVITLEPSLTSAYISTVAHSVLWENSV